MATPREENTYSKGGRGRECLQIRRSPWEKNDRPKRERSEKSRLKAPSGSEYPTKTDHPEKKTPAQKRTWGKRARLPSKERTWGKRVRSRKSSLPNARQKGGPPDFRASFPPSCALREIFSQCPLKTIAFFLRIYYNSKAGNEAAAFCLGVAQFGSAHEWGS